MPQSSASLTITADPQAVWSVFRDFASPEVYLRSIRSTEITNGTPPVAGGCERTITLEDGTVYVEVLIALDDRHRTMDYRMLDGPFAFRNYVSRIEVRSDPATEGCLVQWSGSYECDRESATDVDRMLVDDVYRPGIEAVSAVVTARKGDRTLTETSSAAQVPGAFSWINMVRLRGGEEDRGRRLFAAMREEALHRDGVTAYQWYEADGDIHFHEAFANSGAAVHHIRAFTDNWVDAFLGVAEPVSLVVYGNPDREVRDLLSGFSPRYLAVGDG